MSVPKWPAARAALTLVVVALSTPHPARAQVAAPITSRGAVAVVDHPDVAAARRLFSAWLEGQLEYRELPGVVVGVVADQQLVWAQGFGFADVAAKRPMTPQSKFRMASHSKLFTATAIMQLREEGKVRLDDPVQQHLPWFRMAPAGEDDGAITIEQLLTHSSGLQREAGDHWTSFDFPTSEELRALMSERRAAFAPQVRWKYSNLAYSIAGQVIEARSGLGWAEYVGRHIFTPLGMVNSSVDRDVPGIVTGYGRRMPDGSRASFGFVDARGMAAATGITSTVEDMAKFVSAQFRRGARGGDRILGSGSLREMHRVRSVEETWTSGNAIGFSVSRVGDRTYVGHGGSYPGHATQTLIQLDDRVGVIVLTNAQDSDAGAIARQLMTSVGAAVARATATRPQVVAWDPAWARFAGRYRSRGGDSEVIVMNERLVVLTPNAATLENPTVLEPLGDGRFRFTARTGGGPVGEIVRFVEEGGRVVRMYMGDGWSDRVR